MWRIKDADAAGLPSAQELLGADRANLDDMHPDISEDEDELDKMDAFEAKFNFRFQEDGAQQVRCDFI
jgi:hypothetical protein